MVLDKSSMVTKDLATLHTIIKPLYVSGMQILVQFNLSVQTPDGKPQELLQHLSGPLGQINRERVETTIVEIL